MNYNIVIPVVRRNFSTLKINIPYIFKNLKAKEVILIASSSLEKECMELFPMCKFINEDELLTGMTYHNLMEIVEKRDKYAVKRTGWYLQQFLKMAYAILCPDEYYLSWDADTIPLKTILMFDEVGKPYFDMKEEYHPAYFTTMKKILGIKKMVSESFIAEHMLFKTEYMKEIIAAIELNVKLKGNTFYQKILNSIQVIDLAESGFSEFETYGNYVSASHQGVYQLRKINSLRNGEKFLGNNPTPEMLNWASESYQTITFENRGIEHVMEIFDNLHVLMQNTTLEQVIIQYEKSNTEILPKENI